MPLEDALAEVRAFEEKDDDMSPLYVALAKQAGINPADGPNALVVRLGAVEELFRPEVDLIEEVGEQSAPMLQGLEDILNEENPGASIDRFLIARWVRMISEEERANTLYAVVLKNKWAAVLDMMAIGDRYYANSAEAIFTSAIGDVIVPVGEGCDTLAIRHRGELLGWIEGKGVPLDGASGAAVRWELDFSTARPGEFMDVTEFVNPNPHLRDVVKSLMRLYLPRWKRL